MIHITCLIEKLAHSNRGATDMPGQLKPYFREVRILIGIRGTGSLLQSSDGGVWLHQKLLAGKLKQKIANN